MRLIVLVYLLGCTFILPAKAGSPPDTIVVASSEQGISNNYPSIAKLPDGRLLCAYTATTKTEDSRHARIVGRISHDHGKSWGEPVTLIDSHPHRDYDAAINVMGGRVVVTSTTVPPTHGQFISTSRTLAVRSDDSGGTWSEPYEIPMSQRYVAGKINNGVDLGDGEALFGYAWDVNLDRKEKVDSEGKQDYRCGIKVSRDGGLTWSDGPTLGITDDRTPGRTHAINGIDEPAIVELPDGSLYMLCRTGADKLYESRSTDRGRTWTQPVPSPLTSHNAPASLCRFVTNQAGVLVVWCNSPSNRWPLTAAVSYDNAHTWSPPRTICEIKGSRSAYPGCVQADDGSLVVVWQQEFPDRGPDIHLVRFDPSWLD